MVKIQTVTIHHTDLGVEAEVPPSTVAYWKSKGWRAGPLKSASASEPSKPNKPRTGKRTSPKEGTS